MAVLKDLIVHGSSRFLSAAYYNKIKAESLAAENGYFNKLVAVSGKISDLDVEDLTAQNATVIGLLDVKGELHTNSWTNSNIATIDGSFYITPTVSCATGTFAYDGTNITVTAASGNSFAVDDLYTYTTSGTETTYSNWPQYSKILLTGEVQLNGSNEWLPLGTIRGQIVSSSTSSVKINALFDSKGQTPIATLVELGSTNISNATFRNIKVSLYQRASNSTSFYPIGIYMTALGQNGKTFLDIYGGGDKVASVTNTISGTTYNSGALAPPVLRIGNLAGLPNVGGITPQGWGIYTSNGFFSGTVAAKQGKIGSGTAIWTIGSDGNNRSYIFSGISNITTAGNTAGIYVGTNGISNYASTTQYVNLTGGKITAQGADIAGKITASSGLIGGWNIGTDTNKSLYYGNQTPGATTTNLILSPTSATNSNAIGGSETGLSWFLSAGKVFGVTTAGALYSTSGKIAGWTIDTNDLSTGTAGSQSGIKFSNSTFTATINGASRQNLMMSIGSKFGVDKDGTLYANGANIININANNISSNLLTAMQAVVSDLSVLRADMGTITAGVIKHDTVGGSGGIWFSAATDTSSNITVGNSGAIKNWRLLINNTFGVTDVGKLYATGADISGDIEAKSFIAKDSNNNVRAAVTTDGLLVYDGSANTGGNIVAQFSASNATIGNNNQNRAVVTNSAILMQTDIEETPYFFAGQKSSSSEDTNVSEWFRGDGNQTVYTVSSTVHSVDGVYVNGSGVTYTRSARTFTLSSAPENNAAVEIQYSTSDNMKKYFSIGKRNEDGSIGSYSTSIGLGNTASGEYSVSEGFSTRASARASHSEGRQTWARGDSSHAEGNQTVAYGSYSHAEGVSTLAEGAYSHAQNYHTIADQPYQTAIGTYNTKNNTGNLFVIGNGTSENARSNALTVQWNGEVTANGYGLTPHVLHDNDAQSVTGAVTLSETAANFKRLTICFRTNDGEYGSTDVYHPNGKTVLLTAARVTDSASTYMYIKSRAITINGTSINTALGSYYLTGEGRIGGSVTRGDYIAVTQVIGWK